MMHRRWFLAGCGVWRLAAYQAQKAPPRPESLLSRILKLTGISATSRGLRGLIGPGKSVTGDVWKMASDGRNNTQERLTFDGGYRCPVFTPDDQRLLAVRGQDLVWISMKDSSTKMADHTPAGLVRLVGFETSAFRKPRVVVVTWQSVGLFSPWDGTLVSLDLGKDDEEYAKGPLTRGALEFQGALVSVNPAGHEMTIERADREPVELTAGSKATYADPALSHDGATVAFIRVDA